MYWVSFIEYPDTNTSTIAIRSVFNGKVWTEEGDTHRGERTRIEERFDSAIVSKLERLSGSTAVKGD